MKKLGKRVKLSEAQVRALTYLSKHEGWTYGTPVTQRCLNALHIRGLVGVAFDKETGWVERITDAGREALAHWQEKRE